MFFFSWMFDIEFIVARQKETKWRIVSLIGHISHEMKYTGLEIKTNVMHGIYRLIICLSLFLLENEMRK